MPSPYAPTQTIRQVRDTFLDFLDDQLYVPGLTPVKIPLHALRKDTSNPNADVIQVNAVNVKYLDPILTMGVCEQPVSIDIVHDDELTALYWLELVWDTLNSRFYTEIYDYSDPNVPVKQPHVVHWPTRARFRRVDAPFYSHYTCRLPLKFNIPVSLLKY